MSRQYKGATYYHCDHYTVAEMEHLHNAKPRIEVCDCGEPMVATATADTILWKCRECGATRPFELILGRQLED